MFIGNNTATDLEARIKDAWNLYRANIISSNEKEWTQEGIYGKSCVQYDTMKYFLAIELVIAFYKEVSTGISHTWEYYIEKYKLKENKKCLACVGIALNDILSVFGLPPIPEGDGIEHMEDEVSLEVEPN